MSKIKFGTDGWRAIIALDYTIDNLTRVTEGTISWLKETYEDPSVMIGYDCRFHGQYFAETVANVLAHHGIRVFLSTGYASTPMVSLATEKRQCSAGLVITASHNPPTYSGFKIKGHFGGPATPDMIQAVEDKIPDASKRYANEMDRFLKEKTVQYYDMEAVYLNHIKDAFDLKKIHESGFKVGYDAMYGAGQNAMRKLFPHAELLHCEFNPSFNGTAPEPIEKNLGEFQALIREKGLEFGLANDGDADRIGLFDENGDFVDSHHIILLLTHYLNKYKNLEGKVVYTFSCTDKIKKMCELYGLPYEVTRVGFKYICEIMLNENVLVGGEESGGIAVAGHVPERDGIYIGLMILEMMAVTGKKLTELVQEIYDVVGSFSYQRNDLHLTDPQKQAAVAMCRDRSFTAFGEYKINEIEELDGWKFRLDNEQWIMIRPSGTEPVLRVYAESSDKESVNKLLDAAVSTIRNAVSDGQLSH